MNVLKFHTVGNPPHLVGHMKDTVAFIPDVGTMECHVKLGTKEDEIHWFVRTTYILSTNNSDIPFLISHCTCRNFKTCISTQVTTFLE